MVRKRRLGRPASIHATPPAHILAARTVTPARVPHLQPQLVRLLRVVAAQHELQLPPRVGGRWGRPSEPNEALVRGGCSAAPTCLSYGRPQPCSNRVMSGEQRLQAPTPRLLVDAVVGAAPLDAARLLALPRQPRAHLAAAGAGSRREGCPATRRQPCLTAILVCVAGGQPASQSASQRASESSSCAHARTASSRPAAPNA